MIMSMNEYEDCTCPECGSVQTINLYGWCDSCQFDYEQFLMETEETYNGDDLEGTV